MGANFGVSGKRLNGKRATVEEELRSWSKVTFIILVDRSQTKLTRSFHELLSHGGRVPDIGLLENAYYGRDTAEKYFLLLVKFLSL